MDNYKFKLQTEAVTSALVAIAGIALSLQGHSSSPFFSLMGILLFCKLLGFAYENTREALQKKQVGGLTPFSVAFLAGAVGGLLLLGAAITERVYWAQANKPFSFLIEKDYTQRFTVDQLRLARMRCEQYKAIMEVKEENGISYVRCGTFLPETFTFKTTPKLFDAAIAGAQKVSPDAPIVIESELNN